MKRRRALFLALSGLVVLAGLGWGGWHLLRYLHGPPETEQAFRQRLQKQGTLMVLENASQRAFAGQSFHFTPDEELQLQQTGLHGYFTLTAAPAHRELSGVEFLWGGADESYGVIIMRHGAKPDQDPSHVKQWGKNVWYYSEISIW